MFSVWILPTRQELAKVVVESVQERGHLLTRRRIHDIELAGATIDQTDAHTPQNLTRRERATLDIREPLILRCHGLERLRGRITLHTGKTIQERHHLATRHRKIATERAIRTALRDALRRCPQNRRRTK